MGKNQDPGSGIWDKHPGSATQRLHWGTAPEVILARLANFLRLMKHLAHAIAS